MHCQGQFRIPLAKLDLSPDLRWGATKLADESQAAEFFNSELDVFFVLLPERNRGSGTVFDDDELSSWLVRGSAIWQFENEIELGAGEFDGTSPFPSQLFADKCAQRTQFHLRVAQSLKSESRSIAGLDVLAF